MKKTPACLALLFASAHAQFTHAQFDPARVKPEPAAIARQFPDPATRYPTPGLREGRVDFTSHAEVMAFAEELARAHPQRVRVEAAGQSQQGLVMPLLVLGPTGAPSVDRPTVLILGQQHGNEPAGGEAALAIAQQLAGPRAALLDRVNVLLLPRANPDGAERFNRTTASGIDVNRDHLLLATPEGRAIAAVVQRWQPQVVLDLHEFTVAGRWTDKFGVVQKYDALLQAASVGNLHPTIADVAQRDYLPAVAAALEREGQNVFAYHTTSTDPQDKVVSMGGVQPDTGRNVNGLRQAVSVLIETRGVGLGRAHFARRVHAHVTAALSMVETASRQGSQLVAVVSEANAEVVAKACNGDMVVQAQLRPTHQRMQFLDATSGELREIEVAWRSAVDPQIVRTRARPCGYLVAASERAALERLRLLGARVQPVKAGGGPWLVERYTIEAVDEGRRQDARGAIEDAEPIRVLKVHTQAAVREPAGAAGKFFFVSLAQPLAPLLAAALEPDSQNSYAANRLLDIDGGKLRRVMAPPPEGAL